MKLRTSTDLVHKLLLKLPKSRAALTTICVALALFIGFLDYATGYELDLFLFYFAPIAISAWFVNRSTAIRIALLSTITWLVADLLSNHEPSLWIIEWWNTAIQGSTFLIIALIVDSTRSAFDREQRLNSDLSEALHNLEREIRERTRAEERVLEQNEFLKHVFESLTHPFYVLDANDYTVKMANSAAAPDILSPGTTCYTLSRINSEPCSGPEHICPLQTVKSSKAPLTTEHIHYGEDGKARHVEVHAYPIFDEQGNVSQVIEYTLDITERKRLEEALRVSAERIKLFAYSVSHDLKSPLIGINGLTRLLHNQYRDNLDEKGKKFCDQILKSSEQALLLIEEINTFIKMKEMPLNFEGVSPKEILLTVRDEFDAQLSMRRIAWREPEFIPRIKADRLSMLRLFRNLVDNALKYGGEDMDEIAIGYEESGEFHTFFVTDNGIGIKSEDSKKVFELFQRHSSSKNIEGTGLGLAIVKEIAAKHNGRVWVKPGDTKGVTFCVSLLKSL